MTIEIDKERHDEAVASFRDAGLATYIDARLGDAHEIVPALKGPFDFVFCDADKDWYKNYLIAVLTVAFSIFTLGYFLLLQRRVFFGKLNERWRELKEAPAAMSFAVICLAAQCLLVGVFFDPIVRGVIEPAARALLGGN